MLAIAASGYGQGWAVPAKTPDTPVSCSNCPYQFPSTMTVGYKAPISSFTGRFLDSSNTTEWFLPVRSLRASDVTVMPSLNRIYFRLGNGTVGSYSLGSFFSRLEAGEPIIFPFNDANALAQRANKPELLLKWDEFFNPEKTTAWKTFNVDGSERLMGFDVDDQGYVYIASTIFGWGIVKDGMTAGGSQMKSIFQNTVAEGGNGPNRIIALKGSGRYYALLSSGSTSAMFDVTDRAPWTSGKQKGIKLNVTIPKILSWAKTAGADRAAIIDRQSRKLTIATADGFASGSPLYVSGPGYSAVTSDGTNFYALKGNNIDVLVHSGSTYAVQGSYPIDSTLSQIYQIHYGDGFLVIAGSDAGGGWDLRLYKVSNLALTQVVLPANPAVQNYPSYFRNYYGTAPGGYAAPGYINMSDGTVYRAASGKTYLIVCAKGIGDVYEIQGADAILVKNDGVAGTPNPNTPAGNTGKIFYGDTVKFTAATSSASVTNVAWNFGNPEAGTGNNTTLSLANTSIPYQFQSLSKTTVGNKTVTASNVSDSSIKGSTTVPLVAPSARFRLLGTQLLFAQPNASSSAPIVVGDSFVDGSDGSLEGHFASWAYGGGAAAKMPSTQASGVGQCGPHSVVFTANYGPYTGALDTLTTTGTPYVVGLDASNGAVTYNVLPFSAGVDLVTDAPANNLRFVSTSRFSPDTSVLTSAHIAAMTYKWELLNSAGGVIQAGPTGAGMSAPYFDFLKTLLTNQSNARVRLTFTTTTPFAGSCAGLETSAALSNRLNAPDPTILLSSGTCQASPCTFTAGSASPVDTVADNWSYAWDVLDSNNVVVTSTTAVPPSATGSNSYTVTFIKTGTFAVRVTAQNALGSVAASKPIQINTAASVCPAMTATTFNIAYSGNSCNSSTNGTCTTGDPLTFQATSFGSTYNIDCAPHTYKWTMPDGTVQNDAGPQVNWAATLGGNVTLLVTNTAGGSQTYTKAITVGSACTTCQCLGTCPPTNPCGTMSTSNVFLGFTGNQGCTVGATCKNGENLTFSLSTYQYNLNCATHTYNWNFGDNTSSTSASPVKSFNTTGDHTITVSVSNQYQSNFQRQLTIKTDVSTGGNCPAMTSGNIAIAYSAPSGCTSDTASACKNNETITFNATSYANYDFSCSNHSYSWDFGDGSAAGTGKSPAHTFTSSGPHTVAVTISNTTQTNFKRFLAVTTNEGSDGGGSCGTIIPNVSLSINYHDPANTCGPLVQCDAKQPLSFTILQYGAYDIGCATHTFDWDFGDNSAHSNVKEPVHTYQAGGKYPAKCIVFNGTQTVTLSWNVDVKGGNPGAPSVVVGMTVSLLGVANGYLFIPTFDHPELVTSWKWDFGDNSGIVLGRGTAANPIPEAHIYADDKPHTVTLTAYNGNSSVGAVNRNPAAAGKRRAVKH